MARFVKSCLLAGLASSFHSQQSSDVHPKRFIDTELWVGTEYTPARAANSLWWARFQEYKNDIKRELRMARDALALPALRVFLHSLAWEHVGKFHHEQYLKAYLDIAAENGMKVGFVLFGDSWNHGHDLPQKGNFGANASCVLTECCPVSKSGFVGVKGCSNGCWFANPQDHQRGDVNAAANATYLKQRFKPYVESIVKPLINDDRVLFWEVFNEPCEWRHFSANICTLFQVTTSTILKESAYQLVKALHPKQPVISCWSERNNSFSDILDVHLYNSNFSSWSEVIFSECSHHDNSSCARGAVVTEAGARWFQGFSQDAGSPLTVVNYLSSLRKARAPFVPGVMLAWELMVGNTNTRWSSGPPCMDSLAEEPTIPWCGLMWVDGTPVSFTEAGAIRRYLTGVDPFFLYEDFLPRTPDLVGDVTLNLTGGGKPWLRSAGTKDLNAALYEISFWLGSSHAALELSLGSSRANHWKVVVDVSSIEVALTKGNNGNATVLGHRNMSAAGNYIQIGAWSLLRVQVLSHHHGDNHALIKVWLNPNVYSAGSGEISPFFQLQTAAAGGDTPKLELVALRSLKHEYTLIDYISVLPYNGGIASLRFPEMDLQFV